MRALVLSRLSLSERIIEKLKESGIKEFIDFYETHKNWRDSNDVINAMRSSGCNTVVIIANFRLAVTLLAKGVETVYVIVPKYHNYVEIISGEIFEIRGSVSVLSYKV